MSAEWVLDTELSGREVAWIALDPAERTTAPGPCSIVAVLSGELTVAGRLVAGCELVVAPGQELVAGADGCMLGAIRWGGAPPSDEVRIKSTASRHFAKYESFQAQLQVHDGARDVLAPWELYRVRMVGDVQERVQLHVHHVVTNLLFVPGPVGVERGYLIIERNGSVTATPLVGGDRAIVRPGLKHHVVPIAMADPIDMIVFNNETSAYEEVDKSDFHLVESVPWSEVAVAERPEPGPRLSVSA